MTSAKPGGERPSLRAAAWALLLAGCLAACASPREAGRGITAEPPPASEPAPAATSAVAPLLGIRMDFEVVDLLLDLMDRRQASEGDLDRWARLPGNRELLRIGRAHHSLSNDTLKQAARVTILGGIFPGAGPLTRIDVGPWDPLRDIVAAIKSRREELAAAISREVTAYLPPGRTFPPLRIFFHLGGTWDGRTSDAVYINLTFFQSRGVESLPGLDALLVHEVFHLAQSYVLPGVEDYTSPQSALFTAMLRTEQEGVARHLEYRHLADAAPATSLDRTNFQKYGDGLRHAAEDAESLAEIQVAAANGKLDRARELIEQAFTSGGPLYAVGHAMARTIEERLGRQALVTAIVEGPMTFFRSYEAAVGASGGGSILPTSLAPAIEELRRGYGRAWSRTTHLRRLGRRFMEEGRMGEAIRALRQVVRTDPSDAISAYNLACAHALAGSRRRALSWLEKAVVRGFDRYKHVATDPDLESLHGMSGFDDLLRRHGFVVAPPG